MKGLKILLTVVFTVSFCILIAYLDLNLLTPLLALPQDVCYYHFNEAPIWVKFLYMDSSGHIENFNFIHITLIFVLSFYFGILSAKKLDKQLAKKLE